jgi:hypothetical protein
MNRGLKIFFVCSFLLCFLDQDISAQFSTRDNYNYLDFQKKPYYFGMAFGYNSSGYRISKSREFVANTDINVVESISGPGLNLNMIANLKIGDYFDFRALPGFSFSERNFEFINTNPDLPRTTQKIESVFFEIPFQLRFKSLPYKDKRVFVIIGSKYTFDVQSNSRARVELAENLIQLSPHDFQIEYGVGMQFFFPYFIFSPEIKISRGIGNIHIFKNSLNQSRILETVQSRTFTLSFNFEG